MNIVTIEEQTFKLVCSRFANFANQVERICRLNNSPINGCQVGKRVPCSASAAEVCRTTGTVVNWVTPKLGISGTINLPILKDWLPNVRQTIFQERKATIYNQ